MKRIPEALSLVLLMSLFWTNGVAAASWDFIYECDRLPDPGEWEIFKGEMVQDVCEITPDGELHMTDPADKVCFIMPPVDDVEESTIEVRVKVLSQAGASYTILFGIEDAAVDAWVVLFPDRIQLYDGGPEHFLDMTEYHVLRIAKEGSDV